MKTLFIVMSVLGAIIIVSGIAMDAPLFMYPILLGGLAGIGFFLAPLFKQADEMLASGKIILRDPDFMKNAQIFTLSKVSMDDLIAALKNEGLPFVGLEWKTGNDAMGFRYSDWTAQMVKIGSDENCDRYEFVFLQWQTIRGSAVSFTQMNQLLTAVEKAFLRLDPSTKVQTERNKINTKSSFF